jgi:hypothetical protein
MQNKIDTQSRFLSISALIIIILMYCSNTHAKQPINKEAQDHLILFQVMQDLLPLVLDEKKFNDPNNKNIIIKSIDQLDYLFSKPKNPIDQAPITFRISSSILTRHVKAARKAFISSDYIYSRYILKSLPAALRSYYGHSEHTNSINNNLPLINKDQFASEFDLAEFYYILRNYKQALINYESFIVNNIYKEDISQTLQTALERILAIHLQEYRDPKSAFQVLKNFQQRFVFPEYINVYINEWLKGLELVKDTFHNSHSKNIKNNLTFKELKEYIDQYFHESEHLPSSFIIPKSDQIFYLMLSGYLNDYLYANPKQDEIPAILYWSSLCDRALNYHDNISVADLYLKECIVSNPKSPYAKKCLSEYEEFTNLSYSGGNGDVPEFLSKEIQFLHDLVHTE